MSTPTAQLSEVADFSTGGTPSKGRPDYYEGDIPWITGADIERTGATIMSARSHITREAVKNSATNVVEAGTVLLVTRTSVGKVGIAGMRLAINQDITAINPDPERLDRGYLVRCLQRQVRRFEDRAQGATIQGVNRAVVAETPIWLPPIDEQRRLAALLDGADAILTMRHEALATLETLNQAILIDMLGDPVSNPRGLPRVELGEVALQVTDGEHATPPRTAAGVKLLSARNVRDGYLDVTNVDHVSHETYVRLSKRLDPKAGDLLISCSGTIGRVARLQHDEPLALVRSVAYVRPDPSAVESEFLLAYLRTDALRRLMQYRANASSQANLFQGQVRRLPVLVPPKSEQELLTARLAAVASQHRRLEGAAAVVSDLASSLQQRGFRGEL